MEKMGFPICKVKGHPQFDTLPVMKIIHYPLEPRDYKPFAQGLLAVNEERLYIRLWAFETPPEPESRLLCLLRQDGEQLRVEVSPDGATVQKNGEEIAPLTAHPFTGDDLQGRYWGCLLELPRTVLGQLVPGEHVQGNLYKCSSGQRPHIGSFFPMSRPEEPLAPENDGEWVIREF